MSRNNNMRTFVSHTIAAAVILTACHHSPATIAGSEASAADTLATDTPRVVTVAMTGDIMMGTLFPRERLPIDSGRHIFDDPAPVLRGADVTCGNLEGTMAYSGRPRKNMASPLAFAFMMPPHFAPRLVEAGYDFVGLANNHICDFWQECMTSTERALDAVGIGYAGANDPAGKLTYRESCVSEIGGIKYGFCAFSHEDYTVRLQDTARVRRIITDLRQRCDYVIVCFHGGCEGTVARHLPDGVEWFHGDNRGHLRQFAHFCVDLGADIVYGHGPHVCRAIELYNGHLIAYSLGNFCTTGMGVAGATGYAPVLTARLDRQGRFIDGKIHSFLQQPMQGPKTDPRNLAAHDIATLTDDDIRPNLLNIAPDGTITPRNN